MDRLKANSGGGMTRWQRILVFLASGLVCLAALLPLISCGAASSAQPVAASQAQVQPAPDNVPPQVRQTLAYIRQSAHFRELWCGG